MMRRLIHWWRGPEPTDPRTQNGGPIPQSGAAPYRVTDKGLSVLLITSRRTGRWLFPKGGLMKGREPWESAAQEAFEEAGVEGVTDPQPLGAYRSNRLRNGRTELIEVVIYPLKVTRELDRWPERRERRRQWLSPAEVRGLVSDPDLLSILSALEERVGPAVSKKARSKLRSAG